MADITYLQTASASAPQAGSRASAVHCLLLPMRDRPLLLPNAAVAEIVAYSKPEPLADAPDWLLGMVGWRDQHVPLISFEAAMGEGVVSPGAVSRIAVLNTLNGNTRLPYVAVLTQSIPQLRLVNDDNIAPHAGAAAQPSVAAVIEVNGEVVVVPDIDDLERRVERLHNA